MEQTKNIFEPTFLLWDSYFWYLEEAINESRCVKRTEIKPMSTPKGETESHITSRATHQRTAAQIGRRIAEGIRIKSSIYIYWYAYA